MNIQLRSYLEAELSKARVEEGRLILEVTAAKKQLDDLTRQMDDRSALIAGMRKLLAKADADEVASPAKKDDAGFQDPGEQRVALLSTDQDNEEPEPVSMDAVWIKQSDVNISNWPYAVDCRIDEDNEYWLLMNVAMLTDEQKQKAKKDAQEGDKSQTINVAASLSTE